MSEYKESRQRGLSAFFRTGISVQLFLSALLGHHVGCTKAGEQDNAAAEGSVNVAGFTVTRHAREAAFKVAFGFIEGIAVVAAVFTVEQAAALGEGGETQREDDCCCQC